MDEIDLAAIGVDEVAQADDGVNALRIAEAFRPDIVLADVRMPRMDGIAMSFELRKSFPHCHIVIMSGYADKEYLKSAIELKAVSYIEKPFRTRELREVLARAVSLCHQERNREEREAALLKRAQTGMPLLRGEVALMLVQQNQDEERIRHVIEASGVPVATDSSLAVAVVRPAGFAFPEEPGFREDFVTRADAEVVRSSLAGLVAVKGTEEAILVLYAKPETPRLLDEKTLAALLGRILKSMPLVAMVAAAGPRVTGLSAAPGNYRAACSAIGHAFFSGAGAIAMDATAPRNSLTISASLIDDFQACLDREDGAGAVGVLRAHAHALRAAESRDADRARDSLTRMVLRLTTFAERRGIDPRDGEQSLRRLTDRIERAGTLDAIAALLEARVTLLFERIERQAVEGRLIMEIKRVVHGGFQQPGLSIEDIARDVGLSPASVCRLFKEATGQTIHRYMTMYRLERAKDLLRDVRQAKMTEVAARAGFADANYFARAFRKETGLSPSEFREKASP